jgi:hypothetical protein
MRRSVSAGDALASVQLGAADAAVGDVDPRHSRARA